MKATILQTPEPGVLQTLEDQVVIVGDDGVIEAVTPSGDADVQLADGEVLLPGLIDTHLHAPQWPQLGTGLDLPLERWLFEYTFPLEAKYSDLGFARRVWDSMVPTLLRSGTTTAVYYGSIHCDAATTLAEACQAHGQRAFVGRVAMDHTEGTPAYYRDADASQSVSESARSIDAIRALDPAGALVRPIVTPRFIPACTDAALEGLGELAAGTGTLVQTHCSESDWAHGYVLERHGCTDTESLSRFGLVRDHSILAHATHLTGSDRHRLVEAGTGVAHCPLSNSYFANAVFPARRNLDAGLRVGLGTDVAGGSESSLLRQCEHAVTSSRMLEDGVDVEIESGRGRPDSRIDVATAFWMATAGGAELLGINAGLLEPGRVFDAFAVRAAGNAAQCGIAEQGDRSQLFERIVRRSGPTDVSAVWVNGSDVTPANDR
ncbi:MAG: amidohydrolase family protein [Acidimicrobiales bacterium]